jgi:cytochrome c553
MKTLELIVILMLFLGSTPLYAADMNGAKIAMRGGSNGTVTCAACHGTNGQGMASSGYPYLAGLPAEYIESQLKAFSNNRRSNSVMTPIAKKLQEEEMGALAEYYAGLENKKIANASLGESTQYTRGESLVHTGKSESGVPACVQCHGQNLSSGFPPIVGQPYEYIQKRLLTWQEQQRTNDPQGMMQKVAAGLSKKEIDSVAHYLASQSTL